MKKETKEKKEEVKKSGVEYLIEQGYKKISAKTFISDIDLEKFLNKDFDGINKTRALGFIQILQREYGVDLSDLRSAYLDYELSHRVKVPDTLFVEKPMKDKKDWQKYIRYIGSILLIVGLLYMFVDFINENSSTSMDTVERLEENRSTINEVEKKLEKFEENRTEAIVTTKKDELYLPVLEDDKDNMDLDLDKVVLKMIQERNISLEDNNLTNEVNIAEISNIDFNKSTEKKAFQNEKVKVEIKEVGKKQIVKGNLYIKPDKRAWVGIIYLDNYSKKDFLIRSKLPLDSSRDQLIVIGHKFFNIYNKKYSVNFTGSGPVRFVYRDGELMEISRKEFTRLSEGVNW